MNTNRRVFGMPMKKDRESKGGGGEGGSPDLFRPLPDKSGSSHNNTVIIPMDRPSRWSIFNPTSQQIDELGLAATVGSPASVPYDLYTFYWRFPCHRLDNFTRPDGTVGFGYVVCPVHFNKYLTDVLEYNKLFDRPKCHFCEMESEWWGKHGDRFEQMGYPEDVRRNLGKDMYRKIVNNDMILNNTYKIAKSYQCMDRFSIPVFDYDKLTGARQMDKDQSALKHQLFLAPKKVFDKLGNICDAGTEFFDLSGPDVQLMVILKDTTKCSGRDMIQTEYDVITGRRVVIDPSWQAYLNDENQMVDPSRFIFTLSYKEMKYHTENNNKNDEQPTREYSSSAGTPGTGASVNPYMQPPRTPQMAPPQMQQRAPQMQPPQMQQPQMNPYQSPQQQMQPPPQMQPPQMQPPQMQPPMAPPPMAPPQMQPPQMQPPMAPPQMQPPVPSVPTGNTQQAMSPPPFAPVSGPVPLVGAAAEEQKTTPDRNPPAGSPPPGRVGW